MPNGPYQINIPPWNDTVHIVPEPLLPHDEERARRRDRAIRIESSPRPDISKNYTNLIGAVDDIQDGFVLLAVGSRLVTRFYPPAERVAKILATGTDVTGAAAQVARFNLPGCARRDKFLNRLRDIPNTYQQRLADQRRTRKFHLRGTEVLQAAVFTDKALGTGLMLGALLSFPQDAAALAITGGTLRIHPAEGLPVPKTQDLGPWERYQRLQSLPATEALERETRNRILTDRAREINRLLAEHPGTRLADIQILATLPKDALNAEGWTRRDIRFAETLVAQGDRVSPGLLNRRLPDSWSVEMYPVFGLPALRDHIFGPPPGPPMADILREKRAATEREREARGLAPLAFQPQLDPATRDAILEGAYAYANDFLRAAARILKSWRFLAPAQDDLTDEEHVAALAALNLAWQFAGPWFRAFDYLVADHDPGEIHEGSERAAEALHAWTSRISDPDLQEITRQLITDTARRIYTSLEDPRIPLIEDPLPTGIAAAKLLDTGLTGFQTGGPEGPTIDFDRARAIVGQPTWDSLTGGDQESLLAALTPPFPPLPA